MKRFITILLLILASFISYGQEDSTNVEVREEINDSIQEDSSYVSVKIDSLYPQPILVGDSVIGVLFTVEQARQIDNDYELFSLMDSIISQYGVNDSITIGIIDAQGKKISSLQLQVDNYEKMLNDKEIMLDNRDDVIAELRTKVKFQEGQLELRKEKEESYKGQIKDLKKDVRRQKIQKIVGYIATGVLAVGIVILSVL